MKWIGIIFLYTLPFGYLYLMKVMNEPVEWFAFGFILFIAVFVTLFATVFKKSIEDTEENRETLMKVIKKTARQGISDGDD
jgi:hypothetical protein